MLKQAIVTFAVPRPSPNQAIAAQMGARSGAFSSRGLGRFVPGTEAVCIKPEVDLT